MVRVRPISGGIAGLVATLPMSIAMLALRKWLPHYQRYDLPPSQITKRATRKLGFGNHMDETHQSALSVLAHFGYGTATGTLFAPVSRLMPRSPVVSGILYGLLVWATSYLGLLPALGLLSPATEHPARRNVLMIVSHVIWGAFLGLGVKWFEQEQL
jgi:uncharacterized membrane protein YagU involved in acid resistance